MIKVIKTQYDGYSFRSRLEARWAYFFKELGIDYDYEREGYELSIGWYLPDFWIPEWESFIEIKGEYPSSNEILKCAELSEDSGFDAYLFHGRCSTEGHRIMVFTDIERKKRIIKEAHDENMPIVMQCGSCNEILIGGEKTNWFSLGDHPEYNKNDCRKKLGIIGGKVGQAFKNAKSYKF